MRKSLVIFGVGDVAQLGHYYFTKDSLYDVVAFAVDSKFMRESSFCGLPVVDFDDINQHYPPENHELFIAMGYSKINEFRKEKFFSAKEKGYLLASYVSSHATVLNDGFIGENCFILEDNTIQPFVKIGNNVTLWSGNHVGHHSVINDHVFISSHAVISGGVEIGEQCFVGVNSTFRNHIKIGEKSIIGAGSLVLRDVAPEGVYLGVASERSKVPSSRVRQI